MLFLVPTHFFNLMVVCVLFRQALDMEPEIQKTWQLWKHLGSILKSFRAWHGHSTCTAQHILQVVPGKIFALLQKVRSKKNMKLYNTSRHFYWLCMYLHIWFAQYFKPHGKHLPLVYLLYNNTFILICMWVKYIDLGLWGSHTCRCVIVLGHDEGVKSPWKSIWKSIPSNSTLAISCIVLASRTNRNGVSSIALLTTEDRITPVCIPKQHWNDHIHVVDCIW